jgi:GNAT superfamily N-acetyltransferase
MTVISAPPHDTEAPPVPGRGRTSIESLLIELATVEHVPYLRHLKEQVMSSRYRPAQDEDGFAKWREVYCTDEYIRGLISADETMLLCIGSIREPVGMVVLHLTPSHVEIDDLLCLHPRRGDGRRLIKACLRYAEAWRVPDVAIDVYPGHDNVEGFLTAHGFSHTDDSANALGMPMHRWTRTIESVRPR